MLDETASIKFLYVYLCLLHTVTSKRLKRRRFRNLLDEIGSIIHVLRAVNPCVDYLLESSLNLTL